MNRCFWTGRYLKNVYLNYTLTLALSQLFEEAAYVADAQRKAIAMPCYTTIALAALAPLDPKLPF